MTGKPRKARATAARRPRGAAAVRRNAVRSRPPQPVTRRGRETRARLKAAGLATFNRLGFPNTRIQDIMEAAEGPVSLFYRYFQSKEQMAVEILEELYAEMNRRADAELKGDAFDRILITNRIITDFYARYPGLMRCLVSFQYDQPEFVEFFSRIAFEQNRRVADNLARRHPAARLTPDDRRALAHMLGAMVEQFLFEYYVLQNPDLRRRFKAEADVALFLSILWHRMLFRANPPVERMGDMAGMAEMAVA